MTMDRERLQFELEVHQRAGLRRMKALQPPAPLDVLPDRTPEPTRPAPEPSRGPRPSGAPEVAGSADLFHVAQASSAMSREERQTALEQLGGEVRACQACKLAETRIKAVPGEGCLNPPILFIGEGPGADEDRSGRPFVGRAGQLLDKMIAAIGLARGEVYIANIVKCRPPGNRNPEPDEVKRCSPFLDRQIELIQPKLICTLGLPSTRTLVPTVRSISAARGRPVQYHGVPLVPTFHPAYLLRNPAAKRDAWSDLKLVAKLALGKEIP